ncbi:unnamed protein product [Allacma fusca]|uniref:Cilia- and flagella-associated protein 418 n=1 Tax=Allacma fusca TaxID=39272 RepID=A0A8J2KZV6_9HEXA|nr:unnamed protein product [Allacma fusca]
MFLTRVGMRSAAAVFRRGYASAAGNEMSFTFAAPYQVYYSNANVKQVDVPSFSGSFGILPNHVPTLAVLKPGVVTVYEQDGQAKRYFVSSGSVTVNEDSSVQVLAEEAIPVESIDASAAQSELSSAQNELTRAGGEKEKAEAMIAVEVAQALVDAAKYNSVISTTHAAQQLMLQLHGISVDDIETLLDQVEKKYISSASHSAPKPPVKDCPCNEKTETNWDEVEELLRDFRFEDTNPFGKQNNNSWARPQLKEENPEKREVSRELKCFPVYLSGSYEVMGHSEVGFERPCDKLKCVRCDFDIVYFDNFEWEASTDYLFLRNNMPDFEKLAAKLHKMKGTRAYACQCQHLSIEKLTNVNAVPQLRWVCGKHSLADQSLSTKYTQRY